MEQIENQIENPRNENRISQPGDPNKKIVKWVIVGIIIFFTIIMLVIVGILIAIFVTNSNLKKNEAKNVPAATQKTVEPSEPAPIDNNIEYRKDSFYDLAASIQPNAMTCADESVLNPESTGSGKAICKNTDVAEDSYPEIDPGICDGNEYTVKIDDATAGDGHYLFSVSCNINGAAYTISCNESGCTR